MTELPPSLHSDHPDYTRERYTVLQAAQYLQRQRSRIYLAVARGEISYRQDGEVRGTIRFSQADLDAWRQARRHEITQGQRAALPAATRGRVRISDDDGLDRFMPKVRRFS